MVTDRHDRLLRCTVFICCLLAASCAELHAQATGAWEELMQEMVEEVSPDEEDDQQWEAQQELLSDLHEHPIDLNSVTREQLLALPFLSEEAVEGILQYLLFNSPMRTLGELLLIPELTAREREWLRAFAVVNTPTDEHSISQKNTFRGTRHELLTRADVPLYTRTGWSWARGIAHRLRYSWQQGDRFDAGLRMEKDAGEQLFTRETPFWDSYGGHVRLQNLGVLSQTIVGDYKAGFGEGLVLNNALRFGKQATAAWRTTNDIRPHRSFDEANFLRGAAATLRFGQTWKLTALYSFRQLDATVATDNSVSSINTSGLHRTATERERKGSLGSHTTALHAAGEFRLAGDSHRFLPTALRLGVTAMYQYYDHQFRQGSALYRQLYPTGYQFGNIGIDYGLRAAHLTFSGETARSFSQNTRGDRGGWATLNRAAWRFSPNTSLSVIQRFYSMNYFSPHASAYGENSRVQNESGFTLLFNAERLGPMALRAFIDYFYSPWPRYSMSRSSDGWEGLLQATYAPRRDRQLLLQYRVKSKERSNQRHLTHRLRATYTHTFSTAWSAQATTLCTLVATPGSTSTSGYALAPRLHYSSRDQRLRVSLMGAWFRADAYDSRLYLYEPSLLQTFGMQQLYGRGGRLVATLRFRTRDQRWTLQTKVGVTRYTDRNEISSGILRIGSPWKADVQLLLRMMLK